MREIERVRGRRRGAARCSSNGGCDDLYLQGVISLPTLTRYGRERKMEIDGKLGDVVLL
jgi:hypothetical protein